MSEPTHATLRPPLTPASMPMVIVLAAGRGERFLASGGATHKLQALLAGKAVIDHTLDAIKASGLPYHLVTADASRPGMGDSIAAGVGATLRANGWLILPADLPLIRSHTLRQIALSPPALATVPVVNGQRGHPVRFGPECFQQLLSLQGNQGASQVIKALEATNSVAFVDVDDLGCITDIDTLADLQMAQTLFAKR